MVGWVLGTLSSGSASLCAAFWGGAKGFCLRPHPPPCPARPPLGPRGSSCTNGQWPPSTPFWQPWLCSSKASFLHQQAPPSGQLLACSCCGSAGWAQIQTGSEAGQPWECQVPPTPSHPNGAAPSPGLAPIQQALKLNPASPYSLEFPMEVGLGGWHQDPHPKTAPLSSFTSRYWLWGQVLPEHLGL